MVLRENFINHLLFYFSDLTKKEYQTKEELANEIEVTRTCVKYWLHELNKGYTNHGIISIEYIN